MKKGFLLLSILFCTVTFGQLKNTGTSLDDYFSGVPLKENFDKWVRYVVNHPYLKIDSFNTNGLYSSFKPGIRSFFPFRDSTKVKMLFQRTEYEDSATKLIFDSSNTIQIEAVFSDNKDGKKESIDVFRDLRKDFRKNYSSEYTWPDQLRTFYFSKGKNENFPDCYLYQGYTEELKFYYVIIAYTSPRKHPETE